MPVGVCGAEKVAPAHGVGRVGGPAQRSSEIRSQGAREGDTLGVHLGRTLCSGLTPSLAAGTVPSPACLQAAPPQGTGHLRDPFPPCPLPLPLDSFLPVLSHPEAETAMGT